MNTIVILAGGWEVIVRLTMAMLIGCTLGLNRELHGKPAGMRTHGLVCLAAALITLTSIQIAFDGVRVDGSAVLRTVQGIMAGIGFLGGGVILRDDSHHSVHGLTTAASIFVVACLGIACGAGQWLTAVAALVLTLIVLVLGGPVERALRRRFGRADLDSHPVSNPPAA